MLPHTSTMSDQLAHPLFQMKNLQLLAVLGVCLWIIGKFLSKIFRGNSLPPGPTKLPLIGSALELRGKTIEELISEWWDAYGPIVHVSIFEREIVFINDLEMAQELTEKRGNIYSDRPSLPMFDLLGWKDTLITMPYGDQFRKHRRMMNSVLSEKAVDSFRHIQSKSALLFIKLLTSEPEVDLERHISCYTAATIMKIAYGHDVESLEDPIVKLSLEALTKTLEFGTVSTTVVDFVPALAHIPAWFPFAGFKRRALALREKVERSQSLPYKTVQQKMRDGDAPDCFVTRNIYDCGGLDSLTQQDEKDIQGAAAALYTAAEETTLAVVHAFFLAMLLNPDVYRRAQEEMENVVGYDRLPDPDDMTSLPYLDAVMRELYRWTAPTSINAPHKTKEDDIYRGYFIPKGTNVIVNNFGLLRACPDPDLFLPQRFLDGTNLGKVPTNPRDIVFGFGRRRCPGWHFADRSVWVAAAYITALFDILPEIDESGCEVIPPMAFGTSNVRHPKPFKCRITPRKDRKQLLEEILR